MWEIHQKSLTRQPLWNSFFVLKWQVNGIFWLQSNLMYFKGKQLGDFRWKLRSTRMLAKKVLYYRQVYFNLLQPTSYHVRWDYCDWSGQKTSPNLSDTWGSALQLQHSERSLLLVFMWLIQSHTKLSQAHVTVNTFVAYVFDCLLAC